MSKQKTENGGGQESNSSDLLLDIYKTMVQSRLLDQRVWQLNRQGRAALVASSQGHEALQVASVYALRKGKDLFYTYYRDLAVMVALGVTPREIMLGYMAKSGEPMSGSRQFPTQGAMPDLGLVNLSNVVATQLPQAVGAALACVQQQSDSVVAVYFGDGASSTGDCHEAMNFASVHKLPVLFICENNGYAISVPLEKQMAVKNVSIRANSYNMPGFTVDGTSVTEVFKIVSDAAKRARQGEGPTLIEGIVERYLPHTGDDDDKRYRSEDELAKAKEKDPVQMLRLLLKEESVLTDAIDLEINELAKTSIDDATEYGESASYPDPDGFYDHVYSQS
ncbi:MAG: thiamine pyrophosphate-dependent dehydrogenase E1 component subunit alpha [SAR202 cluster bacterium]|nr:thiamine pyrophosphate-dependent dehydrogenase E1 component subunit alpha [SAR202 cluster bacterium]|tara:strand:+ start:17786 stop:18793 length:1008 start_codon:yes stop_codon:yes gene_type:complete